MLLEQANQLLTRFFCKGVPGTLLSLGCGLMCYVRRKLEGACI
jgi:hypothetical protein